MKFLKVAIIALVVLVVVIWGGGYFLEPTYKVSREIKIAAPAEKVMQEISDFSRWQKWGVWFERDPKMKITITGDAGMVGHSSKWSSETQGNGQMILTAINNEELTYDLLFPDMGMQSIGRMSLTELRGENGEAETLVVWSDEGDVGTDIVSRYFVLFIDELMGPDFEQGLTNLKVLTEKKEG
ncbi:SRPBCC family protein [Pleionea litopenaei]|uniref:SRPBCC family protein n=1 Tax=Pleionea litopenaei TaxID=3070815 RepID=A0AA51X593_9GAMM|nr:SRPBCC family protein [Pleionea sp. HL-JVS1]WMS85568.1 SRPBCC family protein [Pleionea sp. HL-JVS1]